MKTKILFFLKKIIRRTSFAAAKIYLKIIIWGVFRPYQEKMLEQAKLLYQQTPLYTERVKLFGIWPARNSFAENDATFFMWKARQYPLRLKWQIFKDAFWERNATICFLLQLQPPINK